MKSVVFALSIAALAVVAAGGVAADRYAALRTVRGEREQSQDRLAKSVKLASEHPRVFGPQAVAFGREAPLKTLAQELATTHNVALGYLSESERDSDRGRRERQVHFRLVNAAHSNLIRFLEALEQRGGGARVREIHVRPSREHSDTYEEAEVVLSRIDATPEEKKP